MGGNYSVLEKTASQNFICITFRQPDKIRIIDADQAIIELVRHAIYRTWAPGLCKDSEKYGAWEFDLVGTPFRKGSTKEEAVLSKLMACVILQDLLAVGWRIVVSSDLCRTVDLSSWFFVRCAPPKPLAPVFCASLSSWDKLQIVNCPSNMIPVIRDAAERAWSAGIQEDFKETVAGGLEIKFHGNPWNSTDRSAVNARLMLLYIIRSLARHHWILYVSSSLKDTADALFFVYQPDDPLAKKVDSAWIMSLNRTDRMRLLEASSEMQELVKHVVSKHWERGIQKDRDYFGARELKLGGSPWWADGNESVASRHLITVILQELRSYGWHVLETIDISRRLNDKSVFVFTQGPPESILHWCISLNDTNVIRFINTPQSIVDDMRMVVKKGYTYGIKKEKLYYGVDQFKLHGQPWSAWSGNDHMHGRRLMIHVLESVFERGWELICSADVSAKFHHSDNGPDYPLDVHSWWLSGLPRLPLQSVLMSSLDSLQKNDADSDVSAAADSILPLSNCDQIDNHIATCPSKEAKNGSCNNKTNQ